MSPISAILLKTSSPTQNSTSKCEMEIENGIVQFVQCSDFNKVIPYTQVKASLFAIQQSTLKLKSTSMSPSRDVQRLRVTDLRYDYAPFNTNSSAIKDFQKILRDLSVDQDTMYSAEKFRELVHIMDLVPHETVPSLLRDIRNGRYGSNHEALERIYLDATSWTTNAGALEVLVDEILEGKNVFRSTFAMFTAQFVSPIGVKAVKKIFENDHLPASVTLAAGSVLGTYCRSMSQLSSDCSEVSEFEEVMRVISRKLKAECTRDRSHLKETQKTVTLLKAVGNIRRMNSELEDALIQCGIQQGVTPRVKIAAADAIKMAPCKPSVRPFELLNQVFLTIKHFI